MLLELVWRERRLTRPRECSCRNPSLGLLGGNYEFNWARVKCGLGIALAQGQPFGLSQQVDAGQVPHVVVASGQNEFQPNPLGGAYSSIYNQRWSQAQINSYAHQVVGNIGTAVPTFSTLE